MAAIRRVKSGINGLDSLIDGGFLQGSANLVTGNAGTGKTIFGLQFLWYGLKKGERCVYISLEESPEDIKEDAVVFGWDFDNYERRGLFRIIYHDPAQANNLNSVLLDEIKSIDAKRVVIDSISLIGVAVQDVAKIRKMIYNITNLVKRTGCTTLMLSEIPASDEKALSRYGVEEFVADSVIVLNYLGIGEQSNRMLEIRKMRRTNHGKDLYPFEISDKGIVLKKDESMNVMMR